MQKPELLAPAGNLEKLQMAVLYGADAVYFAGKRYGLRAFAGNFTREEIRKGVDFAHRHGAKAYVTVNIFAHNRDLNGLPSYLEELAEDGVDAIIISDPGVWRIVRRTVPQLPVHLSTQANTTNWSSVLFWQEQGIKRVVLARELSLQEIQEIRNRVELELEAFVHGAMCVSYSGRCLLSSFLTGRSANRGECTHPCRWKYHLVEEKRPGEYLPVLEDERGTYIFNSKDLCMLEYIPELVAAGLDSFKIEGRMKSVHYVATVVKAYRQAIDAYISNPEGYRLDPQLMEEVRKVSHRKYTTGFYFGRPGAEDHRYTSSAYLRLYDFIGVVQEYDPVKGMAWVEERNRFQVGDVVEFTGPTSGPFRCRIERMENEEGQLIEAAVHPRQLVKIPVPFPLEPYSLMRRVPEASN
ncbi:peptidase U32 family protein [Calderihabitans maritimus]|uniref:Peptidase U32 n=1 Tax=Calderihabitans maritimus TaxID=1246530 RepID=A0A1Z5HXH5_9FIRM|nr:U32 family peptidase [Calderihabitans maritimus]GAW94214.1 peptidase U32 [Calderihabitans maritimus]